MPTRALTLILLLLLPVFLLHDPFSGTSLSATKWTVAQGSPAVGGGFLTMDDRTRVYSKSPYLFGVNTQWTTRVDLGGDGTSSGIYFHSATNNGDPDNDLVYARMRTTSSEARTGTKNAVLATSNTVALSTPTAFHNYHIIRESTTGVRFLQDATQLSLHTTNIPAGNLRQSYNNDDEDEPSFLVDWVRVHLWVANRPTVTRENAGEGPLAGVCIPIIPPPDPCLYVTANPHSAL